jgi:hypothetical protein
MLRQSVQSAKGGKATDRRVDFNKQCNLSFGSRPRSALSIIQHFNENSSIALSTPFGFPPKLICAVFAHTGRR